MQEEEAGQIELRDHAQLLVEAGERSVAAAAAGRVAIVDPVAAELGQLAVGRASSEPG